MTTANSLTVTLYDTNATETHTVLGELVQSIGDWYGFLDIPAAEFPEFAHSLTDEQCEADIITPQIVASLLTSISQWEERLAESLGFEDFAGHGSYRVSAADRAGIDLRIEIKCYWPEDPVLRTYDVRTDGGDESIEAADWEGAKAALREMITDELLEDGAWGYVINPDDDTRYYVGRENMS